jgi:hypothetical protein
MAKKDKTEFDEESMKGFAKQILGINDSLEETARSFKDLRDFTKQVMNQLKDAGKLFNVIKQTGEQVGVMGNMMEVFGTRSIAARFAIDEMANGFEKTASRQKFLITQQEKFSALERVTAKDSSLATSLITTLTDNLGVSQKKLLDSKTAMLNVDARILEQKRAEWASSTQTLTQLQAQMQYDTENLQVEDRRLAILEQRRILEEDIAKVQSKRMKAADKEAIMEQLHGKFAKLNAEYEATGGGASFYDGKNLKAYDRMQRGVSQYREEAMQNHLAATILLSEKEAEQGKEDLMSLKTRAGYLQHIGRNQEVSLGTLGEHVNFVRKFLDTSKLIPKPFMLLDLILKSGYDRFIALDKAAEEFRKQTGYSNTQMVELRKNSESINLEFQHMGIGIEQVYKSAKALTDVFGRTSIVSKEALQNVSLMSANLGVAEEHSAAVLATFQGLGGASEQAAMNVIKVGAGISDKAGIPFKLVMQDVASASEDTLSMLGANPSKLMKSAIAARSMGLELNKLVSSQRKILDFSNSITDEMEASALLGKNVNFQLARQLAFEGRVEDSARATLETVKNAGDFNKMNVYQREALAKAAGMELKDLTKMMAVEAQRDAILKGNDESKKATLKAQEKELAALKKINDLDSADLVKQNEKALMQQKIQGLITKLKNSLESMVVAIGNILEPIITPLVTIVVPVFSLIAWTVGLIAKGLAWILSPIKWIADGVASIADGTGSWSKTVGFVKEQFKDLGTTVGTLIQIAGAGLIAAIFFGSGGVGAVMGMIAKPFKAVGSFAKSLVEKVKGPSATTGTPDISKGVEKTEKSSRSMKSNDGSGIKSFLTNLAAGLKKMAGAEVFKGALNLIPASIGLVVMIPGVLGAKLLSMVDGEKLSSALEGMARGLKKMAKGDVLLGAGSLTAAALAFAIMTVGAIGLAAVAFLGGPAGAGLELLASGLKAMGKGTVMAGIVSMGLLALAFAGIAYGFKQFAELEWETLAKAGVAIVGFGLAAAGLGYIAPLVIAGSVAIGILGLAIGVFGIGVTALAEGLPILADGIEKMITPLTSLASMAGGLYLAAGGIGAIGIALAAFGAGSAAAGIGNFIGGFLGDDPIDKIKELSSMGSQLQLTADSIQKISTSMSNFGAVDAFALSVDKLTLSLSKLNSQVESMSVIKLAALSVISTAAPTTSPAAEAAPADNGSGAISGKLDELISLMRSGGIAVNLDGRKVSSAMASSGRA